MDYKTPVNDILVSAPESVSSKTRAGGSLLSLCHYFIASSYVIYYDTVEYNNQRRSHLGNMFSLIKTIKLNVVFVQSFGNKYEITLKCV